jgi:hypothetical protein
MEELPSRNPGPTHQKPPDLPQSRRGRKGSQRRSSMSARDHDGIFLMIFRFHSAIFEILCVSQRPLRLCGEKKQFRCVGPEQELRSV